MATGIAAQPIEIRERAQLAMDEFVELLVYSRAGLCRRIVSSYPDLTRLKQCPQVEARTGATTRVTHNGRLLQEEDENDKTELPDRPISPHRNFVTEAGLAAIDDALGRSGSPLLESATRERGSRQTSCRQKHRIFRHDHQPAQVDGREQELRIVGEDEADPSRGTVSYVSPLARAVLTHGPGETVEIAGGEAVILDVR